MEEENIKDYHKEPLATFRSNEYLLFFNILYRVILFVFIEIIVYMLLSILFKFKLDPINFIIKYLPYCLGFSLLFSMTWTFYFHRIVVKAYKEKMIIYNTNKDTEINYASIISFEQEKNYFIIIPLLTDKIIISHRNKRNRLTKLSTLSNEDFFNLLEICNQSRNNDYKIPLRKSKTFFN